MASRAPSPAERRRVAVSMLRIAGRACESAADDLAGPASPGEARERCADIGSELAGLSRALRKLAHLTGEVEPPLLHHSRFTLKTAGNATMSRFDPVCKDCRQKERRAARGRPTSRR
jgi:hypothetical protein